MSGYINANVNVNADDFLSLFRKLYNFIKDKFHKKEPDEELSFEELVEMYSKDNDFLNKLDYIKTSLEEIDELMEDVNFTYNEYYNFLSIKDMITYIASDVGKFIKHSQFIITLLTAFNGLMDSQDDSDYGAIYQKFDKGLYQKEDIFYTEIFESSHEYDDLIDKVTNILGWLIMIHFYDTNVLIGYIYSIDPLNEVSKKAIDKKNNNYYSEHVKGEVEGVAFRKDREYAKFLRKVSKIINKTGDNDLIDLSEVHNAISRFKKIGELDVDNMHSAIEVIWQELGFDENTDAFKVKSNFNNYLNSFQSRHRSYRIQCFNNMGCIPAYSQKDKAVLNKIKKESLRRDDCLHEADEKILFDVHEYLKNNPNADLLFVSGDKRFVKAISILIDVLAFNSVIYLEDFLKN